jgi:hypothetical protein
MFGERGEPMALLEKRNRLATRRSVLLWSVGTAITFFVVGLMAWLRTDMPFASGFFVLPWMTVWGAVVGAAMEWQIPRDVEEEDAGQFSPINRPHG